MNPSIAKAALAFLDRVTLQGSECDAYQAVRQALTEAVNWQPPEPQLEVVEPTDDLQSK